MIKKLLIICILVLLVVGISYATYISGVSMVGCRLGPTLGPELITNEGFETGDPPSNWVAYNNLETFERSTTQKYGGTYSGHGIDSSASYGGFDQTISVTTGKTYRVSFWYYMVSGSVDAFWNNVEEENPFVVNLTITGSWQYYETEQVCPNGDCENSINFNNNSNSVTTEFYIDDVSVREVQ